MNRNDNAYVSPRPGLWGRWMTGLANQARLRDARRAIFSRLPFMTLASDVEDVVYLNWVVPVAQVAHLIPPKVDVLAHNGMTILTILTYRHRHFGPAGLGPLRQVFPSPLQSNWRLYVTKLADESVSAPTVLFIKNVFDSGLYALGSRVFSDALPSHLAANMCHQKTDYGYETHIQAGQGSAPEFGCTVLTSTEPLLPSVFHPFFGSWAEAVAYLCVQDGAVVAIPNSPLLAHAGISLPIPLAEVRPLWPDTFVAGDWLHELGITTAPFCFSVPKVAFRVLWETVR